MPGGITRQCRTVTVTGAVVLAVGLVAMLVAGAHAGDSWGFLLADPPCIRAGECTWDELPGRQAAAWRTLAPGGVTALAGLGLLLLAAALAGDADTRAPRRGAARVGALAGATTVGVGGVCAIPVWLMVAVSPPMGVAGLSTLAVVLAAGVARLARSGLAWPRAAPLALVAVLGGSGLSAATGAVARGAGAYGLSLLVASGAVLALAVGVVAGAGVRLLGPPLPGERAGVG